MAASVGERAVLGGDRRLVRARELTKLFETMHDCTLAEAEAWLAADPNRCKGEFVLIVEGASGEPATEEAGRRALEVLLAELPLKQAVALAAKISGGRKKELYKLALALREKGEGGRGKGK